LTVTVNGTSRTEAIDPVGRGATQFYFRESADFLDVQVQAASNASGVAAPTIEVVRIGAMGGHFVRDVVDAV
jgi:hypothetical protein